MNMQSILGDASIGNSLLNFFSQDTEEKLFAVILVLTSLIILVAVLFMSNAVQTIYRLTLPEEYQEDLAKKARLKGQRKSKIKALWTSVMGLHKLEDEDDLIIDHEYDGIAELDNPIPIWFNALFYSTVLFGVVYFMSYHVFGWGLDQDAEYVMEMNRAEKEKQEYLAKAANLIDENTIEIDLTGTMANAGKAIFIANCAACHGNVGEGGIGPNLTDRSWLHGGEIKDIFRTVKYGVPDKGMVPWEQTLTPAQIAEVSNYIVTLRDTKPSNAKAAEGVELKYENELSEVAEE